MTIVHSVAVFGTRPRPSSEFPAKAAEITDQMTPAIAIAAQMRPPARSVFRFNARYGATITPYVIFVFYAIRSVFTHRPSTASRAVAACRDFTPGDAGDGMAVGRAGIGRRKSPTLEERQPRCVFVGRRSSRVEAEPGGASRAVHYQAESGSEN